MFQLNRILLLLLLIAAVITTGLAGDSRTFAQEWPVEFVDFGMESQFPEGIRFYGAINSSVEVEDIRVTYEVGDRNITQYNYLDLVRTGSNPVAIEGELLVNTNSPERYVPPGSVIKYQLEVLAANGESYQSEFRETLLLDARFEWDTVTRGPVTVYYHGPVQSRAETLAEKTREGLDLMAPVTGAEIETPIAIMLYNNNAEMIKAVVPRSTTISRELITEGQAFGEENTVLVLAGRSDIGTATHEITHVLVGRASNGATLVPFWLNEGLAEFGNLDKTVSYTRYLEWAVGTGRLPTLKSLNRAPGDPNLTLVGYGSGRSAVNFMVTAFGAEKMAKLLATLGSGIPIQDALPVAYGMSFDELENQWRTSIGADLYVAPTVTPTSSVPTATPTPGTLLPLTLEDIAAAGQATATPEAQPTPDDSSVVADASETPSAAGAGGGGSCNAAGNSGPAQAAPLLGISALLMTGAWRSLRRRRHSTHVSDE